MFFFKKRPQVSLEFIKKKLETVFDTSKNLPLSSSGRLVDVRIKERHIHIIVHVTPEEVSTIGKELSLACEAALASDTHGYDVRVILTHEQPNKPHASSSAPQSSAPQPHRAQYNTEPLEHVRKVIVIASGKGGVGKSTSTMLLAYSLAAKGLRVGVLDADIYGPSIPKMAGVQQRPDYQDNLLQPLIGHHNVRIMSLGLMIEANQAAVMRGPMLTKALHQMLRGTAWGTAQEPLDILLIDTPPGTGDVPLSLAQAIPLTGEYGGAIIVTTPQEIALDDVRRCLSMLEKLHIPLLGIIENMSYFIDPTSGNISHIFGEGGGKKLAQEYRAPLLASIALQPDIRHALDHGEPIHVEAFDAIAEQIMNR
jgi:ATP-binding protein involved in chromosome partitioning